MAARAAATSATAQRFRPAGTDWLQAGLVAGILFALYAATAPRTVAAEDDGFFVLSSYFLGVEHPPGYPLFTLIGHALTYLPIGSVAYRVHLASALFGALSGAAAWLCARALTPGRLPPYLAAFALGLSPVFWSQSIIAEVYTLNSFFFLVLMYLGLRICPPQMRAPTGRPERCLLYAMAGIFGLGLSNHWPLMVLVAPAFAVLLWPVRMELLRRSGTLLPLVIIGLLPYAWMVHRSWSDAPINFYGPLESVSEFWAFVSRAQYTTVDQSSSATWLDRIKFFGFLGHELLVQFAVAGSLLAAVGFAGQWRLLGRRVGAFLTLAFLLPSAGLLMLLGYDYSAGAKHAFHVYPLPAYAIAALWSALGFAWLVERYAVRPRLAAACAAVVLALIFAAGLRENVLARHDWTARYAQAVLKTLPENAVLVAMGDPDLAPIAYYHMIENWRPDITIYQPKGLVLANRLFHPLRATPEAAARRLREMVDRQTNPVVFTMQAYPSYASRDRWLYSEVDRSSSDPGQVTIDIPEEAVRFFEESAAVPDDDNAFAATFQNDLRRSYGLLLARSLPADRTPDARISRHLELLANDFFGALGVAEGLILNKARPSVIAGAWYLDKARSMMPSDPPKPHLSRYHFLQGAVRLDQGNRGAAIGEFETAFAVWPAPANPAIGPLTDLYRATGNVAALEALSRTVQRARERRP